jgi:predicted porin
MTIKFTAAALAVFVMCAGPSRAENTDAAPVQDGAAYLQGANQTMFRFSGFGTLGGSHSSEKNGDYVLDGTIPDGAGRSHDWATGNDSRLGLQVQADFTQEVKAVLQIVSEYGVSNSYSPRVEWANVKYVISPSLNVRAGRIGLPTFFDSENRDVGFSYPWIHPPVDLYRQMSFTHSDGVHGLYRSGVGEAANVIKAVYGRSTKDLGTSTSTANDLWGIYDTLEYGAATFRAGYQSRDISNKNNLTGETSSWDRNSDLSVGAKYDPGSWFAMSEWMQLRSTTKRRAMYISGGVRIDRFTPYLSFSRDTASTFLANVPSPTAEAIQSARNAQSTVTLGARWDFMKNFDLKMQYDRVKLSADSNGDLANVPAGTILYGNTFHVFSVTADFIF